MDAGAPARDLALEVALSVDPDLGAAGDEAPARACEPGEPGSEEPPGEPAPPRGAPWLPDEAFVAEWAGRAVRAALDADGAVPDARRGGRGPLIVELSVRLAGTGESRTLNREHRGRDRATNVLSFPSGLPALAGAEAGDADEGPEVAGAPVLVALGDLVLCPEVVRREAAEQGKAEPAHWAHLVVHGTLHLLGLDHEEAEAAAGMEAAEVRLLSAAGLPDPYRAVPDEAQR